jgi:ABC-2 type transport system ATP-binding protein
MDEAERCHGLAILDRGRLVARGTPEELTGALAGRTFEVRAAQPRQAHDALQCAGGVLGVAQIGNSVRVLAADGATEDGGREVERRLRAALERAGVQGDVAAIAPNLEDVFVAATHRGGSTGAKERAG